MRIVFIGTGTGVPLVDRGPSGVVVEQDGHHLLLDGGSGTIRGLVRAGLDFRAIDTCLYTHAHADHTLDLPALVHALNFTPGYHRTSDLRILGPAGFPGFVDLLFAAYPSLAMRKYSISVAEAGEAEHDFGWGRVRATAVPHGNTAAISYRIETADGVVVFSGDCSPSDILPAFARGADLLVSEASFPEWVPEADFHLMTAQAARIAAGAGVKALVLTHFYPWPDPYDPVALSRPHFSGMVIPATDGLVLEVRDGEVRLT